MTERLMIIYIKVREAIVNILNANKELLKIPFRQRAKFEGWLQFELAHYLEAKGMDAVAVESPVYDNRDRTDITFTYEGTPYALELKTPNTNWRQEGILNSHRPISKNIDSIVYDTKKLSSINGVIAFVLFPIPTNDDRWIVYLNRIAEHTGISLSVDEHCSIVNLPIDVNNHCDVIVCVYMSQQAHDKQLVIK